MSDEETQDDLPMESELESLQARAKLMGIKHHPNMGVDKLRKLVNAKLEGETIDEDDDEEEEVAPAPKAKAKAETGPRVETKEERKARLQLSKNIMIKKAKSLVRIRLTCMNPAKADWHGEIYTVQNRSVGVIKQFVPFNAENGWHVSQMMLDFLKNKQCQIFHTVTRNGVKVRQGKLVPEFAIEILPPLTQKELDQIATRQAAQGTMDD